jgi:hypothetical protein
MYDEDVDNLTPTMNGILDNMRTFKEKGIDTNNIGVVFICDGIGPFFRTFSKSQGIREYLKPIINFDLMRKDLSIPCEEIS